MWQIGKIRLGALGLLGLIVLVTTGSSFGQQTWGKRLYERKINEQLRVVVDERGIPFNTVTVLVRVTYDWRLLKDKEDDGPILFTRRAEERGSNSGPRYEPIEVLYANLSDGDLVTVFNERGRCWALKAHRNGDGSFEQAPLANGPRPPYGLFDSSIGPAMKSAEVIKGADGVLQLTVTDGKKTFRYQLRLWEDNESNRFVYYWHPADLPATRPANIISEKQAIAIARDAATRAEIAIQGILPPHAKYEDGRWIITFPRRLPPRAFGGGFDARVTIDAESGKIIGRIEVSV